MIRLIALDLDGTLLGADQRVGPRALAALERARAAGVLAVPASGRQPFSIAEVVAGTFLDAGIVLGSNGAIAADLQTGETLFESLVPPAAQVELYHRLREVFPGVRCVSVRDGGATFVPQQGYVGMMEPGDHGRRGPMPESRLSEVLAVPSLKLVLRDPRVPAAELLAAAQALAVPGCTVVTSGAPFLEVSAAGVHKGSGLERLCAHLEIDRTEVLAFGDDLNDVEMLAWAGHGVAMAHARAEVRAVADEVAPADPDGVAQVLEDLLLD